MASLNIKVASNVLDKILKMDLAKNCKNKLGEKCFSLRSF